MPSRPSADHPILGIACAVLAIFLFSVMDALIKVLQADYSTWQIFFFRSLPALLPIAYLVHRGGGVSALRTRRPLAHLLYAGLMISFLVGFFHALQYLALTDAYAVAFSAPLLIAALSAPLLGERVGPRRWAALVVGFLGVLIVLRPGGTLIGNAGVVFVLLAVVFYALAMIALRRLSRTESQAAIVFHFTAVSVLVGAAALPFVWAMPPARDWALLILIGLVGGVGQILITRAFSLAPAVTVSPFQYTQIVWGVALGWLIFADRPDPTVLLGAAVVIASGLYLLHREARAGG